MTRRIRVVATIRCFSFDLFIASLYINELLDLHAKHREFKEAEAAEQYGDPPTDDATSRPLARTGKRKPDAVFKKSS